jgi:HEAT repeats/Thioredoxin domain
VSPDALLLITGSCSLCPAMQQVLSALLKEGAIGRLETINVAVHPEEARRRDVQSVPWTQIGPYEIQGVVSRRELERYVHGVGEPSFFDAYVLDLLKTGRRARFEALVQHEPEQIHTLARLMTNPQTSMAIRLGIGAVLEEFQGSGLTRPLVPALGALLKSDDPVLRADACHFLTLIGGAEIRPFLEACLGDANNEVRAIAAEGLADS